MLRRLGLALFVLTFVGPAVRAQEKPISFIRDVAPILKENCFACHDAKKRQGKLDMTSYDKLRAGGVSDDTITPGNADDSEFYTLIVTDQQRRMPPRDKGEALPKTKADIIAQWIKQGAKLDAGLDPKADLVKELRVRWQPPTPPAQYRFPTIINALTFTPDGSKLVIGGHHELTVWDASTGKLEQRIRTRAERAYALAFAPDGKLLLAGGRPGQEGDVRVFDLAGGKAITTDGVTFRDGVSDPGVMLKHLLDSDDAILCLTLSADGKKLAAAGCDRVIRVWDISGGAVNAKLEHSVENHADWVFGLALTTDGKHLLSASRDKTAKVWDLASKESLLTFPDHQQTVFGVGVKPDGKVGFSVGADKQLRLWKAEGDGKQIKNYGHGDEVYKVLAHPKLPLVATCSADKSVHLWDIDKGQRLKQLTGLTDFVFAGAFSPDGNLVAAGGYDGEVRIWKVADGTLVKGWNASPGYVPPAPVKKP
jgi:WD40 repeat protein